MVGDLLSPHVADPEARARLEEYIELLGRWSRTHNLGPGTVRGTIVPGVVESLAGARHLGPAGRLMDIGSGGGLPAIPLLVVRPHWRGVLVEPRMKRWAFLRTAVRELGVDAEVIRARREDLGPDEDLVDVVTTRGTGNLRNLLAWARVRLDRSGQVLLWTSGSGAHGVTGVPGWSVVSSPLPGPDRYLVHARVCFT